MYRVRSTNDTDPKKIKRYRCIKIVFFFRLSVHNHLKQLVLVVLSVTIFRSCYLFCYVNKYGTRYSKNIESKNKRSTIEYDVIERRREGVSGQKNIRNPIFFQLLVLIGEKKICNQIRRNVNASVAKMEQIVGFQPFEIATTLKKKVFWFNWAFHSLFSVFFSFFDAWVELCWLVMSVWFYDGTYRFIFKNKR